MSIFELAQKIVKASPNPQLVEKAFEFAQKAHEGQKRLSGEEYIIHPLRVAEILTLMRLDPETIAASLLHDVPDDTAKTLKDIEKEFGKEIAFLVNGVSKLGKLRYSKTGLFIKPLSERAAEPFDEQAENLRKMFFAMAEDIRVILIKLADRLHNMETLGTLPPDRQKRIALETLEIFAPLANRLGIGNMKGKLEDLAFPYLYPKEFEWLEKNVKERYEQREKYLQKLRPSLIKILTKENVFVIDAHSRAKHHWSLYKKLLKHDMNLEKIYDLVALRVVVDNIETCYKVLGIIHKYFKPLPGLIKDYIAFPKPNNYRAIHTTCFCLDGKITEIQIKTKEMHEEDEYGIASHWAYKEGVNPKAQRKRFAWVAQLSNWQKGISNPQEFLSFLKIDFFKNRIFVFTPKGDVIDLPEGATAIDFAYAVHTEIGNHCAGAKINGKIAALSQPLKNGDMLEILVDKNKKPSQDWLEFAKTAIARARIREQLKDGVLRKLSPQRIFNSLFKSKTLKPLAGSKEKSAQVFLAGQSGLKIRFAQCCLPKADDKIQAYITRDRGASVHKAGCRHLIEAAKKWPQKIMDASWSMSLEITAEDRVGLLRDISSAISEAGVNILGCVTKTRPSEKSAVITAEIGIADPNDLIQLSGYLQQVPGVVGVKKT